MKVGACLLLPAFLFASTLFARSQTQFDSPGVDVAVVLAADFSFSMDSATAKVQRDGHAEALVSPQVIAAIKSNYRGCIAVSYFEWSSPGSTRTVVPWTKVCNLADAQGVAEIIGNRGFTNSGRRVRGGTSISTAIDVSAELLDEFPGYAERKIIDISANGTNNDGLPIQPSRLKAVGKGYTINAITLPAGEPQLASYFTDRVVGGPNAFVVTPACAADYAWALRRKLVTEISLNRPGWRSRKL